MSITLNNSDVNTSIVNGMVESGKTHTQIKTAMVALDMVADNATAEAYLEQIGVQKNRKRGFIDDMHSLLKSGPITQAEFYDWLKKNASDSVWKLRSQHDKTRLLTVQLHVDLSGAEFTEELYKEDDNS